MSITKTIRQVLTLRRWKQEKKRQEARAILPMATMREIAKTDAEHAENKILNEWKKRKLAQGYAAADISRAIVIAISVEAVGTIAIAYTMSRAYPGRAGTALALFNWPRVLENAEQALIRDEIRGALKP